MPQISVFVAFLRAKKVTRACDVREWVLRIKVLFCWTHYTIHNENVTSRDSIVRPRNFEEECKLGCKHVEQPGRQLEDEMVSSTIFRQFEENKPHIECSNNFKRHIWQCSSMSCGKFFVHLIYNTSKILFIYVKCVQPLALHLFLGTEGSFPRRLWSDNF